MKIKCVQQELKCGIFDLTIDVFYLNDFKYTAYK